VLGPQDFGEACLVLISALASVSLERGLHGLFCGQYWERRGQQFALESFLLEHS
jgi:hypothetical protein